MTQTSNKIRLTTRHFLLIMLLANLSAVAAAQTAEAPATINRCWVTTGGLAPDGPLTSDGRKIYFVSNGDVVNAINVTDGSSAWKAELGGRIVSDLLMREADVLVVTTRVGENRDAVPATLRSLSKETGIVNWTANLSPSRRFFLGLAGTGIAAVSGEGTVVLLRGEGGGTIWQRQGLGGVSIPPFFGESGLIVALASGKTVKIAVADGSPKPFVGSRFPAETLYVLPKDSIIEGDARGNLISYGHSNAKKLWTFRVGGRLSFVGAAKRNIVAISADNFVYMIAPASGNLLWKRRFAGRVAGAPAIIDDAMIVAGGGDATAYIIDLQKGRFLNQITLDEGNVFLSSPIRISADSIAAATTGGITYWSFGLCDINKNAALRAPQL